MKSPLDNMILKYLDKKSEAPATEKIAGLVKEFSLPKEVATDWVEKRYAQYKSNRERLDPRNSIKKNSHSY